MLNISIRCKNSGTGRSTENGHNLMDRQYVEYIYQMYRQGGRSTEIGHNLRARQYVEYIYQMYRQSSSVGLRKLDTL